MLRCPEVRGDAPPHRSVRVSSPIGIERVILVVLDGLRPDAVERLRLHNWNRLAARGASTLQATTVAPSITTAAMASLLTGVAPESHGIRSDRLHAPRASRHVHPLPRCLRGAGVPTSAYIRTIPWIFRGVASRWSKALGVGDPNFVGAHAHDVVYAARRRLADPRRGMILMHLPDADRAGHEYGWMSDEYLAGAQRLDAALGLVSAFGLVDEDPATLLIAFADHGGGGTDPRDHDSAHPLNATIPLLVSGACVRQGALDARASLLDVPATVLWSFGVPIPPSYAGKPLLEAFKQIPVAA